jgi:hypothetical protein
MSTIILSQFVVRSHDGGIDQDATIDKFKRTLSEFIAERDTENATIEAAVEKVLSCGARVNMDFLVSAVCRELNADSANFKILGDKVRNFVRENSCDKDGNGMPLNPTKRYHIGKGKGGGVGRWSDILSARASK